MALKALLFDKDGTLFDFQQTWGNWAYGFLANIARDAENYDTLAKALQFDPESRNFAPEGIAVAGTVDQIVDVIQPHVPHLPKPSLIAYAEHSAATASLTPVVPLEPLFEQLQSMGFVMGIATNDAEDVAHANLKDANISQYFDFVAGYDSGFAPKPAPDQVLGFIAHTGFAAQEVAMIGDSTHDLHSGKAAGAIVIAVLSGLASEKTLAPHADHLLTDIGHLPKFLA